MIPTACHIQKIRAQVAKEQDELRKAMTDEE